jgi:xylulokinase
MFDIEALEFSKEFTDAFNLSPDLFSKPMRAGTVVGKIRPELVEQLGIKGDPILVLGSHDQICTALGAGVLKEGEAVDGMGTVECITTLFSKKPDDVEMGKMGYPCVPFAVEGLYCTYILNFSCGSTVNWLKKKIMHNYGGNDGNFYKYIESQVPDAPGNLLLLPYLGGAGTPYQDGAARGAILGLSTDTSDGEIYRAIMEGTSMEMRLNEDTVKKYAVNLSSLVATGGCANSEKWMQIKSDIQGHPIKILRSGEGGLCGCAMLSAVATGGAENLEAAKDIFVRYAKEFTPNADERIKYESNYSKYKKIYKTIKEIL